MNKEECIDIINPPYLSIRGNIICSLDDFKKYAIALQAENTKLKQEKEDFIKWLKEEIKNADDKSNSISNLTNISYGSRSYALKETLERLGE